MTVSRIRNFGIVAHVDAGKTTLSERILRLTGRLRQTGEVHEGSTALDHRDDERKMGITITAATARCEWAEHVLHLVDTPGHVDFTVEVARSLRVLDGVVVVLDGVAGVEPQTETVWRQADAHRLPRVVFVNKLDRPGASFARCVAALEERFGVLAAPVVIPIEGDADALLDVVAGEVLSWSDPEGLVLARQPAEPSAALGSARNQLLELASLVDEGVLEDPAPDRLRAALREGCREGLFVPAFAGSAYRNRGVQPLLDGIVSLLPSPLERAAEGLAPDPGAPLAAYCFKVVHDRFGALTFARVYAGTLREGQRVLRVRSGDDHARARVGRVVRVFADAREDVPEATAGEVIGLLGGDWITGDVLSDPEQPAALAPIVVPEPVTLRAIEPITRKDRDRLGAALRRLLVEDPSLRVRSDPETGQTLLAGMGELHLDIAIGRLRSDHGVAVEGGAPLVAYRETLAGAATVEEKLRKQSGGPGQFAHVVVRVTPGAPGTGLSFEDRTSGGEVPRQFVPAIEKGLHDGMTCGPLGQPVVDVGVELLGGSFHAKDSHDRDFQAVASRALRRACAAGGPVLLEPWMKLEVTVPSAGEESVLGDVLGDLASRRGQVTAMEAASVPGCTTVRAELPLAKTFGYAARLASLSHGRGSFALEPLDHRPVPPELVDEALRAAG